MYFVSYTHTKLRPTHVLWSNVYQSMYVTYFVLNIFGIDKNIYMLLLMADIVVVTNV